MGGVVVDGIHRQSDLWFQAFGPTVAFSHDQSLLINGRRERALLAALLLHPGHHRSVDVLSKTLWNENQPKDVRHALQTLIMRLRRHLPEACVETTAGGYRIAVGPANVDVHLFEALVDEARACIRARREDLASNCYNRALRQAESGDPWEDLGASKFGRTANARIVEMRLAAEEELGALDLMTGRSVVGRLQQLSVEQPLRERRWCLLMRALYESGRQSEALRAYATARITLRNEVGVDPGRELEELERLVLGHESLPPFSSVQLLA